MRSFLRRFLFLVLPFVFGQWTQIGNKLVGKLSSASPAQGNSVSFSTLGDYLAIGGPNQTESTSANANFSGSVWIFKQSGTSWLEQAKLNPSDGVGHSYLGYSVSLSGDGATLAAGGSKDNNDIGATWIYVRSGTTWSQQGNKLIGAGSSGSPRQGSSVSLSTDGNTLATSGITDSMIGAVWIFIRNGVTWTQQGNKLVGTGNAGPSGGANGAELGFGVALSSSGDYLAFSGVADNAAWIFFRSSGTWQQQAKVTAAGFAGTAQCGASIAINADGSTIALGLCGDNSLVGAIWIFTRSGVTWSAQGSKLIASDSTGSSYFGWSVALSDDGNMLTTGGISDNVFQGAVWTFNRSGTVWSQQGNKLKGTGASGDPTQGFSVSLSGNGNFLASGGSGDSSGVGSVWVFEYTGSTQPTVISWTQLGSKLTAVESVAADTVGSSVAVSDDGSWIAAGGPAHGTNAGGVWLFNRNSGSWTQSGSTLIGTGAVGTSSYQGYAIALSGPGDTLAIGGINDDSDTGAVWTFVRSSTTWTQQAKLVGTGYTRGTVYQGSAVALSYDGNTLANGAYGDTLIGAVWIFFRTGVTWNQQGVKLVPADNSGENTQVGYAVALSKTGDYLAVGGPGGGSNAGGTWVYFRTNGNWAIQTSTKLIGTGATEPAFQGVAVALSANGDVLATGGYSDDTQNGAIWIFARTGTSWAQQGNKLTGSGMQGSALLGSSIAMSDNGDIITSAGYLDNSQTGAIWTFKRSGGTWTQQGSKLIGTGVSTGTTQGYSLALTSDASILVSGAVGDSSNRGGVWIFESNAPSPVPANNPTPQPTPPPTPQPTPPPTPQPTPVPNGPSPNTNPTPQPTPAPTPVSNGPSPNNPTPAPTPTPGPNNNPTPSPTPASGPNNNPTPGPTPPPTLAPTPVSGNPNPTPAPTPVSNGPSPNGNPTPSPTPKTTNPNGGQATPTPAPPSPAPTPNKPATTPTPTPTLNSAQTLSFSLFGWILILSVVILV